VDVCGWAGAIGQRVASHAQNFHQSINAQSARYPFHIVGRNVQRHFGADPLEVAAQAIGLMIGG
jgi:hypothetical protein